jgi:enamine deaminase RidA (YjgF/YER057c/UK114 family)
MLLVGGTASVCGEDSLHVGDIKKQTLETFQNLASVARSATGETDSHPGETRKWLDAYHHLRVYYLNAEDVDLVSDLVNEYFPSSPRIELARVRLCRPELLVEIEGLARAR